MTDTNDTPPIPPVEISPIPILPNLVIASLASAIKGNRPNNKKINVQRFFAIVEGFAYASTRKNGDKEYVCAHFISQEDVDAALKLDTSPLKFSKDEDTPAPQFVTYDTIKPLNLKKIRLKTERI